MKEALAKPTNGFSLKTGHGEQTSPEGMVEDEEFDQILRVGGSC